MSSNKNNSASKPIRPDKPNKHHKPKIVRARSYGNAKLLMAIDFGTFGCAVAYCAPGAPQAMHFVKRLYVDKDKLKDGNTEKVLSAILIDISDPKKDEIVAIGQNAQTQYFDKKRRNLAHNYLYFEHFKKELYNEDDPLHKDKEIYSADENGSRTLSYLITKMLYQLKSMSIQEVNDIRQVGGQSQLTVNDIYFVITIPAIWDEMCKEFMSLCAKNAGIKHFELALEPVAATFCVLNRRKQLDDKGLQGLKISKKCVCLCVCVFYCIGCDCGL